MLEKEGEGRRRKGEVKVDGGCWRNEEEGEEGKEEGEESGRRRGRKKRKKWKEKEE